MNPHLFAASEPVPNSQLAAPQPVFTGAPTSLRARIFGAHRTPLRSGHNKRRLPPAQPFLSLPLCPTHLETKQRHGASVPEVACAAGSSGSRLSTAATATTRASPRLSIPTTFSLNPPTTRCRY